MRTHDKSTDTASQPTVKPPQTAPTKRIVLTREQAARWLILLSQFASWESTTSTSLIRLRDQLEDACWLARWKREYLDIDVCPVLLADVTSELLAISQDELSEDNDRVLQEIVKQLSQTDIGDLSGSNARANQPSIRIV